MQIEKRMEKLKKGKGKDSQSKLKVSYFFFYFKVQDLACYTLINIDTLRSQYFDSLLGHFVIKEEAEKAALERIQLALMDGKPARSVTINDFEKDAIKHLCLLTMKPIIYVANVAESDLAEPSSNQHVREVMNLASQLQSGLVTISAEVW